ncbi:MAG: tetratricopeptide repeat protein, partial [Candidatus Thorarchaeota archaeon]|nr:tetratricopeptide repeat protein [Candidatus Thorarchaeota archaeon]
LTNLGIVLGEQGEYEAAISIFRRLLQIDPEDADIWVFLADPLTSLEKNKEAAEVLEKAIKLDPNDHTTWSIYSTVLSFLGREDEAAEAESKAEELAEAHDDDLRRRGFL